jgi:hypothetical protein
MIAQIAANTLSSSDVAGWNKLLTLWPGETGTRVTLAAPSL